MLQVVVEEANSHALIGKADIPMLDIVMLKFSDDAGFELSDGVIPACVKEDAIGPNNDQVFDATPETLAAVRKHQVSPEELCPAIATG